MLLDYFFVELLDYFQGQGNPILLESTVKTGANQLGAPCDCVSVLGFLRAADENSFLRLLDASPLC